MANVGNVFYPMFTNVFFYFLHVFLRFLTFLCFHLNVYYIYGLSRPALRTEKKNSDEYNTVRRCRADSKNAASV